ncbi:MAG: Cys-Gln thioester bond-forming surface protein [Anaerolineae bacterium]|nr:Cys-Gln thioester bond-forming surface protein [Anaerolineae bacterium]
MDSITATRRNRTWLGFVLLSACLAALLISPVLVSATGPSGMSTGNVSYGISVETNYRYEGENLPSMKLSPKAIGYTCPDFVFIPADGWMLHGKGVPPGGTWHGTFGATEGCEPTPGPVVEVYCDDSSVGLKTDACHELKGSVLPKVQWILCNYFPQTSEPAALTINDKAAAVQEAIWHFTNGEAVSGDAADIVSAANNAGPELATPWSLTLSQAEDLNPIGTQHTVTAELRDGDNYPIQGKTVVQFMVFGMNPACGCVTTGSDGKATFSYTGTNVGTDTITAQVSYVRLGALRWEYGPGNQGLIKADPHPEDLVEELTKRWMGAWVLSLPLVASSW